MPAIVETVFETKRVRVWVGIGDGAGADTEITALVLDVADVKPAIVVGAEHPSAVPRAISVLLGAAMAWAPKERAVLADMLSGLETQLRVPLLVDVPNVRLSYRRVGGGVGPGHRYVACSLAAIDAALSAPPAAGWQWSLDPLTAEQANALGVLGGPGAWVIALPTRGALCVDIKQEED